MISLTESHHIIKKNRKKELANTQNNLEGGGIIHCPFLKGKCMIKQWKDYELPTSMNVNGNEYSFSSDFREILEVMKPLNDPDLLDEEKIYCSANLFFDDFESIKNEDIENCINQMMKFLTGNKEEEKTKKETPVMDWEKDLGIIIAPINRIANHDIRNDKYIHWWTFLSYFMEIGECTFSTYVGIRTKRNKGKKLESYEQEIYKNNINAINIVKRYDSTTQSMLDEAMALLGKR
jgi:hypothetical protein